MKKIIGIMLLVAVVLLVSIVAGMPGNATSASLATPPDLFQPLAIETQQQQAPIGATVMYQITVENKSSSRTISPILVLPVGPIVKSASRPLTTIGVSKTQRVIWNVGKLLPHEPRQMVVTFLSSYPVKTDAGLQTITIGNGGNYQLEFSACLGVNDCANSTPLFNGMK